MRHLLHSGDILATSHLPLHSNMGGIGTITEPLVVIILLISGTWINRNVELGRRKRLRDNSKIPEGLRNVENFKPRGLIELEDVESRTTSPSLLVTLEPEWRKRSLKVWGINKEVTTRNTRRFKGYFLSRLLERFPFLVECWYWVLIYWVRPLDTFTGIFNSGSRYTNSVELLLRRGLSKALSTMLASMRCKSLLLKKRSIYSTSCQSNVSL
jgi:hypothetical protein